MQHRITSNRIVHVFVSALMIAALLTASFGSYAYAAENEATQEVTAATVTGTLTGGVFSKIWLGFAPSTVNTDVTITATWDREDPNSNGLNFFVLDETNLTAVVNGEPLQGNNVGSGGSVFQGPGNQQVVTFSASSTSYTVVVANDSATDATFTLTTGQGFFSDDSDQVVDPSAPAGSETPAAEGEATVEAEATAVTTDTVVADVTPEVNVVTEVTTTTVVTETDAPTVEVVATAAPVISTAPVEVRANSMRGALPEQDDQHFLALVPEQRDGEISLSLTFDPQDSTELARRLNFWVLDQPGFQSVVEGTIASEVAIAAGNRTFSGDTNERVATFTASGMGPYIVIVYNNSQVPATYQLVTTGGVLVDDSRQTITAQEATVSGTGVTTATTTSTATTTTTTIVATAGTTATTTATTGTGVVGEAGGSYTVKAGDTLAIIARDVYGDFNLYNAICSFNNITNCNVIEVGQVIQLPTQAQIDSNATAAPATGAAAAAATPAAAATAAPTTAASTTVTDTETLTATATTTATTAAPRTTPGSTGAALPTATTPASATASGDNLIAALEANGNFTILVDALKAAGLDDDLAGAGPYTLFAPTDAAFNELGSATVNALMRDTAQIESILLFHVVQDQVGTADITDGMESTTLQGSTIEFTRSGAITKVQDSNIIVPDVAASNGVIQVIDKVMLPPAN